LLLEEKDTSADLLEANIGDIKDVGDSHFHGYIKLMVKRKRVELHKTDGRRARARLTASSMSRICKNWHLPNFPQKNEYNHEASVYLCVLVKNPLIRCTHMHMCMYVHM